MWKKWIGGFILTGLLAVVGYVVYDWTKSVEIPEMKVKDELAKAYIQSGKKTGIPWPYLAAADEVELNYKGVNAASILRRGKRMAEAGGGTGERAAERALKKLLAPSQADQAIRLAKSYDWAAASLAEPAVFPFAKDAKVDYGDTWGVSRTYGGKRTHEGTDLFAAKGTPLRAVRDSRVVAKGWNELGGWRLSLMDGEHSQIIYYYAHLSRYAEDIQLGSKVKKGQVIGYVGDSGYGPEGTTGKFAPHLHFGIYVRESLFSPMREAMNPYVFLRTWESRQR
ncbi:M23 family metallopeptidase [Salinithrix halophila]|uniref:M23 family metallopeptidase n=1 Tax=Salinithrix halophila TaxID=1485204 RepID=A0ABV8JBY5_9BACL